VSLTYLTTDPNVIGILAWTSLAITVLGFAVAIWQMVKTKRAADAARAAVLGLGQRVRSRELLAKLGDELAHLEAARNHVGRGERQPGIIWLELSSRCAIEAREISRRFGRSREALDILVVEVAVLTEQLARMPDQVAADPGFNQLQLQLRRASERLQEILA
jgi:hypothetical protein